MPRRIIGPAEPVYLVDANGDLIVALNPLSVSTGETPVIAYSPGEYAILVGDEVCRWVNDKVPGATLTVLTDGPAGDQPGIYYNLNPGEIIVISAFCMELTTINDSVIYELGCTDQPNGAGTFTPITPQRVYTTGAANQGFEGAYLDFGRTPAMLRYSDGIRSITFRVDCNDAGATITPAWHGYILEV